MMKILFLGFCILPFAMMAQNKTLEVVAKETCECSHKIDYSNVNDMQVEMQLGLCIFDAYNNHKAEVDKHYGKSLSIGSPEFEKFAEDVGMSMVGICPEIFMNFLDEEDLSDEEEYFSVSGQVVKTEQPQFLMIHLKDENNSIQKFIFLYDAINSNLLRDAKSLNGKNVQIDYSKIELYDPVIDDFRSYNVIEEINLK